MSIKPSKTDVEGYGGWTDLHEDILLLIKEKLKIVDQLCFRAVCKNWSSVSYLKSADQLPWILVYRSKDESGKDKFIEDILYDPSNRLEYTTLGDKSTRPYKIISRKAYYTKFGWIFLASDLINGDCILSLYHPFTRTTIVLPSLRTNYCGKGTFSTVPTHADCVFCVACTGWFRRYDAMTISIYRTGDAAWRMFQFKIPCRLLEVHDLFYMKGNFYFVFDEGSVWAFDIVSHDWGKVPIDTSQIINTRKEFQNRYTMKMVVSNGEVLLVFFCGNLKPWHIFKLDWSLMEWAKEVVLGNRALFLGNTTSLSITTSGEIKSLAGQIHFRNKFRFNHYSFKNNGRRSKTNKLRALVNKYYSYFRKDEGEYDWVWIEPYS